MSLDPHTIIFDPKEQIIRIIDLPELNRLGENVEFRALGKSQIYSSPESVEGLASQMESDYYSLGVVMYEIMTRKKVSQQSFSPSTSRQLTGKKKSFYNTKYRSQRVKYQ